jgi:hypothetical protein
MTALLDLAERCEKAEGASYVLDHDIRIALGIKAPSGFQMQYEGASLPAYTASVDAALALVPEGWHPSVILRQAIDAAIMATRSASSDTEAQREFTRRLAAFICAAALRARAANA